MSAKMTGAIAEASPRFKARIAGVLYLVAGMTYSYADGSVRGKLVDFGNAAVTAHNILAHQALYARGFAAELISAVCYVIVTLLLYDLFKPVNGSVSMLAAFFSLMGCTIQALSSLFHLAPLIVLGSESYLSAFGETQLQSLALMFLRLRSQATDIYMEFFGCYCLLIGYLIFRSTFLPRFLGIFMAIAGLSYQLFLSPPLAARLFRYVVAPAGALGELSLILWLVVMGVNAQRWEQRERAALGLAH